MVLDDFSADCAENVEPFALITHHFRRHTNAENVPEQPYFTTTVKNLEFRNCDSSYATKIVEINAPAPGTPTDSLYSHPTVPCAETGYHFAVDTNDYPLPLTVYRPFIQPVAPITVSVGELCTFTITARNPATDISDEADNGIIYNEQVFNRHHSVKGANISLTLSCENLPDDAVFNAETGHFTWTPGESSRGAHQITFVVNDGIIPEKMTVNVSVN